MSALLASLPLPTGALGVRLGRDFESAPASTLVFGLPELERLLPDGGLPRGQVVELALAGSCLGTSLCLGAVREAQQRAALQGGEVWCAFIDPERTLYAPAVARAGIELERLLVLQPESKDLSRVAIQLVEAHAFAVIVIDLLRLEREHSTREWQRAVRRMALAAEHTKSVVVLLTSADRENRALSGLPVGLRVRMSRSRPARLTVAIEKDRRGRVSDPRHVPLHGREVHASGKVEGVPGQQGVPGDREAELASGIHEVGARELRGCTGGWEHPRHVRPRLAEGQLTLRKVDSLGASA